ncbi:hypothetical protein ACFWM7_16235 [Streptomyces sp. NPDC058375]|uniref:hypothetical protein n=1 Tax=Streptomyces sp. NPDC058375 TaxID=3346467 RepID=UPI003650234E
MKTWSGAPRTWDMARSQSVSRPTASSCRASTSPLRISQYARRWRSAVCSSRVRSTPSTPAISRSVSRRTSSMSSAASYSSLRARGSCVRRSRFSAQSRAHISGFVASSPRSRRVPTARRRAFSYRSSSARSSSDPHSERAARCQWPMKTWMSARLIASSVCGSKPEEASQLSETAEGRVVTTYLARG